MASVNIAKDEGKDGKKDTGSYRGTYFGNRFWASRGIYITEFKFLGPAKKDKDDEFNGKKHRYDVKLYIYREEQVWPKWTNLLPWIRGFMHPYFRIVDLLPPTDFKIPPVGIGEKIIVKLPTPFYFPPGQWLDVKFQLNGPDTERTFFKIGEMSVGKDDDIVIHVGAGARQLLGFKYIPLDDLDIMG